MSENNLCFSLSEEQQMMKDTAAQLTTDIILDDAHRMDEEKDIPDEYLAKIWELGLSISPIPEDFGGYGMPASPVLNAVVLEELSAGDMAFAIAAMLPSVAINILNDAGNEEQKKEFLPLFISDSYSTGTIAINEPVFNFDAATPQTMAALSGNDYIISGQKCFVPLAERASHIIIAAMTEEGPSLFIAENSSSGITIGEREKNLGLYALPTYGVTFDNCKIPACNKIGDSSDYHKFLEKSRIAISAAGTGVARASYEYSRDYARERQQFGEPIGTRQSVAFMIAEMAYEVDAMRLLTWKAASSLENGIDARRDSYLARLYCGDMAMKIADYGVQVMGGHGYVRDHPVERYYRNARGIAILEGLATV